MFLAKKVLLLAVLCVGASVMAADVVSDTIKLSEGGVNEDVILAWAQQQPSFQASAENIIALKDHKVSDKVILTLIKGNENTPLSVTSNRVVADHGWLRKSDATIARRVSDQPAAENQVPVSDPQPIAAPQTTYVQPATTYVQTAAYAYPATTVAYVDSCSYGYPTYYGGYPYYSSYYGGYPYYGGLSLGFYFGGHYGHGYYGGGYRGGYYGGGYRGGYYGGGRGGFGSGYSYGRGGGGFSRGGGRR